MIMEIQYQQYKKEYRQTTTLTIWTSTWLMIYLVDSEHRTGNEIFLSHCLNTNKAKDHRFNGGDYIYDSRIIHIQL